MRLILNSKVMSLPKLSTARVLSDEEMLIFRGGRKCNSCTKGCTDGCKSSCKPGNSNTGSGNEIQVE